MQTFMIAQLEKPQDIVIFPEIIKEDRFWDNVENQSFTKYLGRQEG